ncbi:MAG TPA: 4-hydroxyphenylpyruvate dioxygenase [Bdellovibrionales bacterium]|nr:4-hydroxyphenylpyruvate dioxygenase [Bdellovibrionales bacterium]
MEPTQDPSTRQLENPLALDGIEFIEYATPDPAALEAMFFKFGFTKIGQHKRKQVTLYRQNQVNFVINNEPGTFAAKFAKQHGPSICATGFRVKSATKAFDLAVQRGARPIETKNDPASHSFPAIYGIGDSAVYFVDRYRAPVHFDDDFRYMQPELHPKGRGLMIIDHLTNNVPKGEMQKWCDFYAQIFNFHEVRKFDIKGQVTGLTSKVMRSPCGKITIPINEPTEGKSQIQEYLDEYHGSGIQHLAMSTRDILTTVKGLMDAGIEFLDAPPDTYYEAIPGRVPNVREDIQAVKDVNVLVDGDSKGYLLQIFTRNLIGPIFFEIIQRQNHSGFGEGNFQALFDAIERDQKRRGYL